MLALIIFLILVLLFFIFFLFPAFSIAPWVPCQKKDLERIDRLADLEPSQVFCDLGCGDGRVLRYVAKKNPEARVIGIELSFPIFLWAKFRQFLSRTDNVEIKFGNALNYDISRVDVVYSYALVQSINNKLKAKFERESKKEAKVLSYAFSIEDWPGKVFIDRVDSRNTPIYVYER